jgi:hypothetical protein
MSKYSSIFLLSDAEYENIGDCLRLRKFGSWLAEEAWKREEQGQKRAQFTLRAIALAKKIAIEKEVDQDEAFAMLQGNNEGESILSEYSEEAMALMSSMPSAREQFGELITIFFRNRGEILSGKKWTATDDWTIEDTQKLPQAWLEQVEAFMAIEDGGQESDKEQESEEEGRKN